MEGSRSGGLIAATWAAMVQLGREGYRRYARQIFETAATMQESVRSHPELRILGNPTFLFSFTSDEFDIYLVNDFMRQRGWRFNGQQYPNALHMAVTRPQTQPGLAETFATDLADGVAYARDHAGRGAGLRGHLRRHSRRADRRGRRLHQDGDGRHDGQPAGHSGRRLNPTRPPDHVTGLVDPTGHELFALAVDLGTGGPKIGLVSLTGTVAWSEHVPVVSHRGPGGAATQDAEQWWQLICSAGQRAVAAEVVPASHIVAVSCTGQWASTVPVDADGLPVGDCLLWSDTRGADRVRAAVGGPVGGYAPIPVTRWIRRNGGVPSTSGDDPIGHILFIEHDLPAVAAAARWYLEPVDYLAMRFTGVAAATPASMAGAWLTDNRHPDRLGYDPVLVGASGVPAHKLPPLRPTGSIVGGVLPPVAARLGLPPGVAVVAGTPDLHSAAVGAGAVGAYQPHLAISTSSWISCPYPTKKTDPFRQMTTVVGVTPGLNLVANNQNTAGGALEWLRGCLAEGTRTPSYEELTGLAGQADPGSGGLVFTPWLAGERSPVDNRRARGGFHNLSLRTSRARHGAGRHGGCRLQQPVAKPGTRTLHRSEVRLYPGRRGRRPLPSVVRYLCLGPGTAHRTGRRTPPGQSAGQRSVGRHGSRLRRPHGHPLTGVGRDHIPPGSDLVRRLRQIVRRVPEALRRPPAHVPATQSTVDGPKWGRPPAPAVTQRRTGAGPGRPNRNP